MKSMFDPELRFELNGKFEQGSSIQLHINVVEVLLKTHGGNRERSQSKCGTPRWSRLMLVAYNNCALLTAKSSSLSRQNVSRRLIKMKKRKNRATYSPANSCNSSLSLSSSPFVLALLTIWTRIGANSPSSASSPFAKAAAYMLV